MRISRMGCNSCTITAAVPTLKLRDFTKLQVFHGREGFICDGSKREVLWRSVHFVFETAATRALMPKSRPTRGMPLFQCDSWRICSRGVEWVTCLANLGAGTCPCSASHFLPVVPGLLLCGFACIIKWNL